MYNEFLGKNVTIIVSSRGDNILEYRGTLYNEDENSVVLCNADIGYMMLNFQRGIFGGNINEYKSNIERVVINKRYIISCDK